MSAALAPAPTSQALAAWLAAYPYARFLGLEVSDHPGAVLVMRFAASLVGNPALPAIHGGALAGALELTAHAVVAGLARADSGERGDEATESAATDADGLTGAGPRVGGPVRTVSATIDYLRSAGAQDTYLVGRIGKRGRRIVHVHAEAWQTAPDQPVASARVLIAG